VPDAGSNLMPTLDVFCLPSRTEGLPMAMMEAMAAGAVVVATAVGGIPAVIQDGRNGFIVQRGAAQISSVIGRLAADPRLLASASLEAIRTISEKYTCERVAQLYLDLYRTTYTAA
jgi:glycosyltransferase involved in cell wall biosynthesis